MGEVCAQVYGTARKSVTLIFSLKNQMEFSNETFTDFSSRYVAKNDFFVGEIAHAVLEKSVGIPLLTG